MRLMVWICLSVNNVLVIIATSILRSVHKPIIDSVLLHIDLVFTRTYFNIGLWLLFCCRVGLYSGSEFKYLFISQLEIDFWDLSILYDFIDLFQISSSSVVIDIRWLSNPDENRWQREVVVHIELIYGWISICVLSVKTYMHESMNIILRMNQGCMERSNQYLHNGI